MDPAVFSFHQELYELKHTLECIYRDWKRASPRGAKVDAVNEAQMEVANKPWLRSLLPEWLRLFSSSPKCQSPASDPFLGSRLALGVPWSLQRFVKRRKARLPARSPASRLPVQTPAAMPPSPVSAQEPGLQGLLVVRPTPAPVSCWWSRRLKPLFRRGSCLNHVLSRRGSRRHQPFFRREHLSRRHRLLSR